MKRILSMMMIALLGAFIITSCDKTASTQVEDTSDYTYDSYGFYSSELTDTEVTEPCEESPMDFKNGPAPMPKMIQMKRILKDLQLTDAQIEQVKIFHQQHIDCITTAMQALKASEREIISAANTSRRALLDSLNEGLITKEDVRIRMRQLALETKTALRENPLRETTMTAIRDCIETYLENIGGILTEEQLVLWEEFLTNLDNQNIHIGNPHHGKGPIRP